MSSWTMIVIDLLIAHLTVIAIGSDFDPDIDICDNPVVDAAVFADTNVSYIFKGNYYWMTANLGNDRGIKGFANLISSKWPQIKGPVKAAFVVPLLANSSELITIFVEGDRWYGYQNGVNTRDGQTHEWPSFDEFKVSASVELRRGSSKVIILHSDNKQFTLYDFSFSLSKPTKPESGRAMIRDKKILFFEEIILPKSSSAADTTLDQLCNASAMIAYDKTTLFISSDNYCFVDPTIAPYEKLCDPTNKETKNLFKCPLDLSSRSPPAIVSTSESVMSETDSDATKIDTTLGSTTDTSMTDANTKADQTLLTTTIQAIPGKSDTVAQNETISSWDEEQVNLYSYGYIIIHVIVTIVILVLILLVYQCTKKPKGTVVYLSH